LINQESQEIEVLIPKEMLKKYVAYSRTRIFPVATPEAMEQMKIFYINIREMRNINQNAPVPITVRSLEAVQRLSEASARMRLSNEISREDVEFATKLMFRSLKDIGMDENGILDAHLLIGLSSKSQQDKTKWILEYLDKERTEEEAISHMKCGYKVPEDQTRGLIQKLVQSGKISHVGNEGYKIKGC